MYFCTSICFKLQRRKLSLVQTRFLNGNISKFIDKLLGSLLWILGIGLRWSTFEQPSPEEENRTENRSKKELKPNDWSSYTPYMYRAHWPTQKQRYTTLYNSRWHYYVSFLPDLTILRSLTTLNNFNKCFWPIRANASHERVYEKNCIVYVSKLCPKFSGKWKRADVYSLKRMFKNIFFTCMTAL
jgi:hypothetical protein